MWLDLAPAGNSDNIDDTVDYRQAIAVVKDLIKNSKFALVEKLAEAIADGILELNLVDKVRVQLYKVAPPIPDFGGRIQIDITRNRVVN